MIGTAISDHGFQAIMFDCFEDVFRELDGRCQPHVVIAEIFMPGLGGIAGISKARKKWPEAKVIAMTAGAAASDDLHHTLGKARRAGADSVLTKPFEMDALIEQIKCLLDAATKDRRVLIIEDSSTVRMILSRMLDENGYEVASVETMEAALASPDMLRTDLVITDIFMPGEGGIGGIPKIRKTWPGVRIVAMSGGWQGMTGENALLAATKIGADAVLRKPFTPEILLNTVRELIGPGRTND